MGTRVMKGRNCLTVIMDVLCVVTFLPANIKLLRDSVYRLSAQRRYGIQSSDRGGLRRDTAAYDLEAKNSSDASWRGESRPFIEKITAQSSVGMDVLLDSLYGLLREAYMHGVNLVGDDRPQEYVLVIVARIR